ncbi:cytochrome b/b6 domain-containing protein [Bacillus sp. FJAT-49705]|uniref:Cytochrome b/b6 domain-containing protein n=1 Tax=Cytobacillus citreus TaxID=2833586 RepID=A0ABS5NQD2_9BACI|nr:cytochrome b/b6 domain-containing protein [Cytobacillus citreus]MBS4190025.1 cytochrome b/b6 domain-containing protein [Cytobacillus citreus]
MSNGKTPKTIKRFNKGFIIAHWVNAGAFFTLYISALPMYTEFFDWLYPVFGGPAGARLIHRIAAVAFMLPLFIMIIFDFKGFKNWMKNIFSWKKHDLMFFPQFLREFFGLKAKVPKQDFFNAGEKVNSWLMIVTTLMLISSGLVMWFPAFFPSVVVWWAYPIHNIGLGLAVAVAVGHIYMSLVTARPSMRGITKGDVTEEYAKDHHGRWYDELQEEKQQRKQA